jgi:hypothetical protein
MQNTEAPHNQPPNLGVSIWDMQGAQGGATSQQPLGDPIDGGHSSVGERPTLGLLDSAYHLMAGCMRSPDICAEFLGRIEERHFASIDATDLVCMPRVLKRTISVGDVGPRMVALPSFRRQLGRALEIAVSDRHVTDPDSQSVRSRFLIRRQIR